MMDRAEYSTLHQIPEKNRKRHVAHSDVSTVTQGTGMLGQ